MNPGLDFIYLHIDLLYKLIEKNNDINFNVKGQNKLIFYQR